MSATKKGITLVALSLAGCVSQSPQFAVPDAIRFGQDTFVKLLTAKLTKCNIYFICPKRVRKIWKIGKRHFIFLG